MQLPDIDSAVFSELVGGMWHRTYANRGQSGRCIFVFRNDDDSRDIRVLRNDICPARGQSLKVPGVGGMTCHSCLEDPSLSGLHDILAKYDAFEVLRYRPGKRIAIAAIDDRIGPVIIKLIAGGIVDICERLTEVAKVSNELKFQVSAPIEVFPDKKYFVQKRLSGQPVGSRDSNLDPALILRMATAVKSLHASSAKIPGKFDSAAQDRRTRRYTQLIRARLPSLSTIVDTIERELGQVGDRVNRRMDRLVPVHGSLHSHQWLADGEQLALVDFDRAAMGHSELDIATFLAEFDYEDPTIGAAVNGIFLHEFLDCDWDKLSFYRAHKHVAKAYKASRHPQSEVALAKTRRNLKRTLRLIENKGGD